MPIETPVETLVPINVTIAAAGFGQSDAPHQFSPDEGTEHSGTHNLTPLPNDTGGVQPAEMDDVFVEYQENLASELLGSLLSTSA